MLTSAGHASRHVHFAGARPSAGMPFTRPVYVFPSSTHSQLRKSKRASVSGAGVWLALISGTNLCGNWPGATAATGAGAGFAPGPGTGRR